jgi:hypothetical protein
VEVGEGSGGRKRSVWALRGRRRRGAANPQRLVAPPPAPARTARPIPIPRRPLHPLPLPPPALPAAAILLLPRPLRLLLSARLLPHVPPLRLRLRLRLCPAAAAGRGLPLPLRVLVLVLVLGDPPRAAAPPDA